MKKLDFKSGTGSELWTAALALVAMTCIVAIIVTAASYDAVIQTQIVADCVIDGAVAYAQNNMNVSEVAFEKMATKIYNANQALKSGDFVQLNGLSLSKPESVAGHLGRFGNAERLYINERSKPHVGSVQSYKFNFYDYVNNTPFKKFSVPYSGPAFMDQILHVEVSATLNIPFSKMFNKTSSATTFSLATVPYNSRASQEANSTLAQNFSMLEKIAYAEVETEPGNIAYNNGDYPKYGSFIQKAILEARRFLGDSYSRKSGDKKVNIWGGAFKDPLYGQNGYWPALNKKAEMIGSAFEAGAMNAFKDCYAFVSSCFGMYGGLDGACARFGSHMYTRNIQYTRAVTAASIWEEFNPSPSSVKYSIMKFWYNGKPGFIHSTTDGKNYVVKTSTGAIKYFSKSLYNYELLPTTTLFTRGIRFTRKVKKLTLEEAKAKYAGESGAIPCYSLAYAEPWDESMFKVGDIIIWTNPNWNQLLYQELDTIYAQTSKDSPVIQALDACAGTSGFTCHYAMYIGNGMLVECTTEGGLAGNPSVNGPHIGSVYALEPNSTLIIAGILRLGESGNDTIGPILDVE